VETFSRHAVVELSVEHLEAAEVGKWPEGEMEFAEVVLQVVKKANADQMQVNLESLEGAPDVAWGYSLGRAEVRYNPRQTDVEVLEAY